MIERRYGICRIVFLVGPWAIKVPRVRRPRVDGKPVYDRAHGFTWSIPRGLLANQSERDWSDVDGVAPVLRSWLGGLVNVYPRCEPWPPGPDPEYDAIGVAYLPRDRKPENIGLLDGKPVWLDYDGSWNGCPHSRSAYDLSEAEA